MAKMKLEALINRAGVARSQSQIEANGLLRRYQREFGIEQGKRFFVGNVSFEEARKRIKESRAKR